MQFTCTIQFVRCICDQLNIECGVMMCACSQHDAQELLRYLLEGLHEDLNRRRGKKRQPIDEREYDDLKYVIPYEYCMCLYSCCLYFTFY